MNQRIAVVAIIIAAFAALVAFAGSSQAQYPSPEGNVTAKADNTSPGTNSDVTLTCEVKDEAGAAKVNVPCIFKIESQPGTDASLDAKVRFTDGKGIATNVLHTGSTSGAIVISMTSDVLSSTVIVQVGGALPPAAPLVPPNTGDGGLACTSCR